LGVQGVDRLVGRDPRSVALLLGRLLPLLPGLGALVSSPIHPRSRYRTSHHRQRLHSEGGGRLEGGPLVVQKGLDGLPQVFDQMKPVDHLHGLGSPLPDALGVEGTPVTTDHRDSGMLRGIHLRRDTLLSIAYSEKLNSGKSSATLQSTDRHQGIVDQKRSHFQRDS
jgi:hypothetical protein